MISGIKVGLRTWKEILKDFSPKVCEVWFRTDWVDRYKEMFTFLRRERISAGLHFWGILPGEIMPNFAFPDKDIRDPSVELVKKTIDVAAKHGLYYVNIHPGSYRLSRIDFNRKCVQPVPGRETTTSAGETVLFETVSLLHDFATKRGVLLLTETIPSREPGHWRDLTEGRIKTQDFRNVSVSTIQKLAEKGFFICNDICHTAADVISDDRDYLFDGLMTKTKRLAPQTRLIHTNTMPPPFNGTDGHLGIRDKDFEGDVFPSRNQLKTLLALFVDREDVWVIPEPFSDHVENTRALEEILEEIREEG